MAVARGRGKMAAPRLACASGCEDRSEGEKATKAEGGQ